MLKEIFYDRFENFELPRICMKNHASVPGWQKLFISDNMLFQLVLTKFFKSELFSCLPKDSYDVK